MRKQCTRKFVWMEGGWGVYIGMYCAVVMTQYVIPRAFEQRVAPIDMTQYISSWSTLHTLSKACPKVVAPLTLEQPIAQFCWCNNSMPHVSSLMYCAPAFSTMQIKTDPLEKMFENRPLLINCLHKEPKLVLLPRFKCGRIVTIKR